MKSHLYPLTTACILLLLEQDGDEEPSVPSGFADTQGSADKHAFEPSSIPTLRQVKARARASRGQEHHIARLRQLLLEQFDDKEELKRRFRHTRAPHDRSLLIAAQEGYIQTKEKLANALRQTKSS